MMSKLLSFCLCFILMLSLSCKKDNNQEPPIIIPTIEDEFNVQMWEHLSPNGSTFSLLVETIDDQNCLNSIINSEVSILNNNLVVNLNGIETPSNCQEGAAPASGDVSFSTLTNGDYDLELNILSVIKNQGFIEITPSTISLELISHDGVQVAPAKINRVPNNTFWGYIALDKMTHSSVAADFMTEIDDLRDNFSFEAGNYGYFKFAEDNSAPSFDVTTAFPDHDKFVIKYNGDVEDLRKIVEEYRENTDYLDQLEIRVMTFEGEEI